MNQSQINPSTKVKMKTIKNSPNLKVKIKMDLFLKLKRKKHSNNAQY